MADYKATIVWTRTGADFLKGKYSREHTWKFDGGLTVPASSSPHVVPLPWSNAVGVDPEEAFVAAIASCHMLTFVWLASRKGFTADSYVDEAVGTMAKNERGIPWVSEVKLRPCIAWSGEKIPAAADLDALHHAAHEQCYIAQSVKTKITVESSEMK